MFAKDARLVVDRRAFLAAAGGLVAAGLLPRRVLALAGLHSRKVGTFDVTVLSDGQLSFPITVLTTDASPDVLKALPGIVTNGDNVITEANPVLVRAGSDIILFDTGSGANFAPTAGKIRDSLAQAAIAPEAVTRVVFTHAHPDHIWGTLGADGKPAFPNAVHHVAEAEWNFWTDPGLAAKMPKEMGAFITGAQVQLAGVKDKIKTFKPGDEIVTGIAAIDLAGHTPGHVGFQLAGGDGLILAADCLPQTASHVPHPEWRFGFDAIPDLAIASRRKLLDRAATDKIPLLGFHWAYPGIGTITRKGDSYGFDPIG